MVGNNSPSTSSHLITMCIWLLCMMSRTLMDSLSLYHKLDNGKIFDGFYLSLSEWQAPWWQNLWWVLSLSLHHNIRTTIVQEAFWNTIVQGLGFRVSNYTFWCFFVWFSSFWAHHFLKDLVVFCLQCAHMGWVWNGLNYSGLTQSNYKELTDLYNQYKGSGMSSFP